MKLLFLTTFNVPINHEHYLVYSCQFNYGYLYAPVAEVTDCLDMIIQSVIKGFVMTVINA